MMGKLYALSRSKSHAVRIYSKSIINLLSGAPNNIDEAWSTEKETDTETVRRRKKKKKKQQKKKRKTKRKMNKKIAKKKKTPKRINAGEKKREWKVAHYGEKIIYSHQYLNCFSEERNDIQYKDNKFEVCNICETTEQIEGKM